MLIHSTNPTAPEVDHGERTVGEEKKRACKRRAVVGRIVERERERGEDGRERGKDGGERER